MTNASRPEVRARVGSRPDGRSGATVVETNEGEATLMAPSLASTPPRTLINRRSRLDQISERDEMGRWSGLSWSQNPNFRYLGQRETSRGVHETGYHVVDGTRTPSYGSALPCIALWSRRRLRSADVIVSSFTPTLHYDVIVSFFSRRSVERQTKEEGTGIIAAQLDPLTQSRTFNQPASCAHAQIWRPGAQKSIWWRGFGRWHEGVGSLVVVVGLGGHL